MKNKMTMTEFKKTILKTCKQYTICAYDSTEKHTQKVLIVSGIVDSITYVHANREKNPSCIIVPSLHKMSNEDKIELMNYVGVHASFFTIRDLATEKVTMTIEKPKNDRLVSKEEFDDFEEIKSMSAKRERLMTVAKNQIMHMKDTHTLEEIKQALQGIPEFSRAKSFDTDRRKKFEDFMKLYEYNPYDYNLVLDEKKARLSDDQWKDIFRNIQEMSVEDRFDGIEWIEVIWLDSPDEWSLAYGNELFEDGFASEQHAQKRLTDLENKLIEKETEYKDMRSKEVEVIGTLDFYIHNRASHYEALKLLKQIIEVDNAHLGITDVSNYDFEYGSFHLSGTRNEKNVHMIWKYLTGDIVIMS